MARSVAELDCLRPAWLRLEEQRASMFQCFVWNKLAAELLGEPLHVVYACVGDQEAIIPTVLLQTSHGPQLAFLGGPLFDYRDALASGADALAAARMRLAENGFPLQRSPARSRSARVWEGLTVEPFAGAPMVALEDVDAAAFAARHPRLGRQVRRLSQMGAELQRRPGRESAETIRRIFASKASQFGNSPQNVFQDPACVDFMAAICVSPEAHCEVFSLESSSEVAAAIVTFLDGRVRRFYATYFDPAWERQSPGQALLFEATRLSLAEGCDCDYMTGEQPYKMRLATRVEPLFMLRGSAEQISGEPWRAYPERAEEIVRAA